MPNNSRPNAFRANTTGAPEPTPPTPSAVTAPRTWRLEHRDVDGSLLAVRCDAFNAKVQARINEPWVLSCELPYTAENAAFSMPFKQLWLYDDTDVLRQRFFFGSRREISCVGGIRSIRASLPSFMALLKYDTIETSVEYQTVAGALGGVIGAQQNTPAVSLGDVTLAYAAGAMPITLQNMTALSALMKVYEESGVGGVYWVDPITLELEWERDCGPYAGNLAATAINVASIRIEEDYGQLATRIVAQGEGIESSTRLVAEAEDSAAQTAYGIRSTIVSSKGIRQPSTLTAYAESQLSVLSVPRQSISVDMVDLSKVSASYGASEIQVGQWLRVIDTVFNVEARVMVHSVEFDITNPGDVKVEIGDAISGRSEWADPAGKKAAPGTPSAKGTRDKAKDIVKIIADVIERDSDSERIDPGFDRSLRDAMFDPPAPDDVDFADLGVLADSDFTGEDGAFSPDNPDSIFSPENPNGDFSPFNPDSFFSPDNPASPLSPEYPGGALNPSNPNSPLGGQYALWKPWVTPS